MAVAYLAASSAPNVWEAVWADPRRAWVVEAAMRVRFVAVASTVLAAMMPCVCPLAAQDQVHYREAAITGPGSVVALRTALGKPCFTEVLWLNRVDAVHAARLDTLVVPSPCGDSLAHAPFPLRFSAADSFPKLVLVSLRTQAFGAYRSGRLVWWGPVSSGGRENPTPAGLYFANWKAAHHRSTVDSTWVMPWTVNFANREGFAFHQYALPGHPASHCCVRLLEDDARWLYTWVSTWTLVPGEGEIVERGTPIVIVGAFDFDMPAPWKRLPQNPEATRLSDQERSDAEEFLAGVGYKDGQAIKRAGLGH